MVGPIVIEDTVTGNPKESILPPILINIFLCDFSLFMKTMGLPEMKLVII